MKTILAISTSLALLAGAASASDKEVALIASAPAICTLPTSWSVNSSTGGGSAGQFTGTTWNIPASQFASANGSAVTTGGEIAIRLRGAGVCNTSHTISVESSRGGLTAGNPAEAAPSGFANRRPMTYEAYWVASGSSSSTVPLGPRAKLVANMPGSTPPVSYTVSSTLAPPGNRSFDLRIGMPRDAVGVPLIAGTYSDTVTVTLAAQ
jgi:hypothetical protein